MEDIFAFFGNYFGNMTQIRTDIDRFFISGVALPTKKVKEILQHIYSKNGFVRKSKSTDLDKLWEIPTETKNIRDKRHKKVVQFTIIK